MTVIVDADELVAERADENLSARIARVIFKRLALQYDFRRLPSRLRGCLLLQIARTQAAGYVTREIFYKGGHRRVSVCCHHRQVAADIVLSGAHKPRANLARRSFTRAVKSRSAGNPDAGGRVPAPFRMSPFFRSSLGCRCQDAGGWFRSFRPSGLPFPLFRTGCFSFSLLPMKPFSTPAGIPLRACNGRPAPFGPKTGLPCRP